MIIRVIAIDPQPRPGHSDVLVYQVPENSREFELLTRLFDLAQIEWTSLGPTRQPKKRKNGGEKR